MYLYIPTACVKRTVNEKLLKNSKTRQFLFEKTHKLKRSVFLKHFSSLLHSQLSNFEFLNGTVQKFI